MNDHDAAAPDPGPGPLGLIPDHRPCVRCGYDLYGLAHAGLCPECGAPVSDSLRGPLLKHASPDYLASVHRGVFLVLAGIIAQILAFIFLVGFTVMFAGDPWVQFVFTVGSAAASIVVLWGWWLTSSPDPGVTRSEDAPRARQWVRIATIIQACATVVTLVVGIIPTPTVQTVFAAILGILVAGIMIVSLLATVAAYFAQMIYVRWLAGRIPNPKVAKRAKLLMWLGPILYTVGMLAFFLGPLIALILYWNMLEWVRIDLKRIRRQSAPEAAPLPA